MTIMALYSLTLNGQQRTLTADGGTSLLHVLRNEFGINSAKYGCGTEQCGACRVLVDGEITCACTRILAETSGADVVTVEGLSKDGQLHPLQRSFLGLNAGQCGYCLSGILITAYKLLQTNSHPSRSEIAAALKDNLCRCGAHNRIIDAIESVVSKPDE